MVKFIDGICSPVKEEPVVGDDNGCMGILFQIGFQPFYGLYIQMVGGLIQKEDIRLGEEKPDHGNLGLFPTGKLGKLLFLIFFLKTKSGEDTVVFLFPGEPLPIPFIRTWTGL